MRGGKPHSWAPLRVHLALKRSIQNGQITSDAGEGPALGLKGIDSIQGKAALSKSFCLSSVQARGLL